MPRPFRSGKMGTCGSWSSRGRATTGGGTTSRGSDPCGWAAGSAAARPSRRATRCSRCGDGASCAARRRPRTTTGAPVGRFGPEGWRRGGPLWWDGRELALQAVQRLAGALRAGGGRPRARPAGGQGVGQPARARSGVDDLRPSTPRCCCSPAYVVRALAEDAGSTAGATGRRQLQGVDPGRDRPTPAVGGRSVLRRRRRRASVARPHRQQPVHPDQGLGARVRLRRGHRAAQRGAPRLRPAAAARLPAPDPRAWPTDGASEQICRRATEGP